MISDDKTLVKPICLPATPTNHLVDDHTLSASYYFFMNSENIKRAKTLAENVYKQMDGSLAERLARQRALLSEAQSILKKELESSPQDIIIMTCLSAVLCDAGIYQDAFDLASKAIALGSTDANSFYNLGVAIMNLPNGRHEDAMESFKVSSIISITYLPIVKIN